MTPFTDYEMQQQDRAAEKRARAEDWASKPTKRVLSDLAEVRSAHPVIGLTEAEFLQRVHTEQQTHRFD